MPLGRELISNMLRFTVSQEPGQWGKGRMGELIKKQESALKLCAKRCAITYIIIKQIEINISCKLVGQILKLTFNVLRSPEHFVIVMLGRCFWKPLANVCAHLSSYSHTIFLMLSLLSSRLLSRRSPPDLLSQAPLSPGSWKTFTDV